MGYASGQQAFAATDTIYDAVGDLVVGTGADTAAKLAITVPAANILNVLGVVNGETTWSVKSVHDATAPAAVATSAVAGTALTAAHRDHVHPHETAHLAHDTLWDAAGDLAVGTGADTAAKLTIGATNAHARVQGGTVAWQGASAATPAAVATAAAVGTAANPPSADDHAHLWTGSTFAAVAASGVPKLVRRTGDATAVQTSVLANDDTLLWAIAANEVWYFQAFLLFNSVNTTMDWQVGWSVPTSCTMSWGVLGSANTGAAGYSSVALATTAPAIATAASAAIGGSANNGTFGVSLTGVVVNSTNAGNVNLQWAQQTTNANNFYLAANSLLILWRLA